MSGPKVTEEGLQEAPEPSHQGRWVWLIAGLVVGVGLSVLFVFADPEPLPSATTVVSTTQPVAMPGESGMASVVSGFPDGLQILARGDGLSLRLIKWPVEGPRYERSVPFGASNPPRVVEFDYSQRYVATLLDPDGQGVLYAGPAERGVVAATGVSSYAWHDRGSHLAYVVEALGESTIWAQESYLTDPELITHAVGIGSLVAYGDWGFATQSDLPTPVVHVLTPEGDLWRGIDGWMLGSNPDGRLVVFNGRISIESSDEERVWLPAVDGVDRPRVARFSPDGSLLAILGEGGLAIVDLDDLAVVHELEVPLSLHTLDWSSDSRFVVFPAIRGLFVVRVDSGVVDVILDQEVITGVGIIGGR